MHRTAHRGIHSKGGFKHGRTNLLALILENDGISQRDLAQRLDMRPSSVTEMIVKMESEGLVTRRQDENDQRVMRVYLTEEGKNYACNIDKDINSFMDSIFGVLTETEREQMFTITEKLCKNLEKLDKSNVQVCSGANEKFYHSHRCCHGMRRGHGNNSEYFI
jgi:DNA-binding MarR family transcriptional regulator